ncbi:carotenoid oxygenase family protein [Sorangium sp. So ce726]|uniref:carotenoid oxygenase family protein n=1 Tax=Sorangium sp. So ce726 TaxID=3133319 RepID=UPI003F5E62CB
MNTDPISRSIESVVPFRRSSEVREAREAAVTGELPEWLHGELVRTCPAVFEGAQWRAHHWFDGLCMIYAFRIGASSVKFQSRLLESEAAHEIAEGPTSMSSFGTPTGRTWWQRALQPIQRITDNTNVNLVKFGEDLVALTEGDRQLRIDAASLRSLGALSYARDALTGSVASAHPHFDFRRQKVVNFATTFSANGLVSIYEHGGAERSRRVIGSWRTRRVPYMHSFGLTPTRAILVAHPLLAKPLDMLWSNRGYIDHFEWRPEEGTRLVVIDRGTGRVVEYETDPMFVFHTVNAFERDGATVLDLLAYPDAGIMYALRVERMVDKLPDLRPSLLRLVMRPGRARAHVEKLSDVGFEFPSTNYRRVSGSDYGFAWGASDGPHTDRKYPSSIVKVDLRDGKSSAFSDGEHVYGEPVFVARPGASNEDDGVLLSVGTSQRAETSAMAIIDARTMTLVAKAAVPQAIPLGFHGSFIRQDT